MAPGPTDLEAWEALQAYAPDLDKVRKPKELKEAMHDIVSRTWDMSESRLDFVDFGVIWIDPHFRQICNKFAEIGPGRETFNMATYRTLKTSRLEGVCYISFREEPLVAWKELPKTSSCDIQCLIFCCDLELLKLLHRMLLLSLGRHLEGVI